ncbi:hypothetical protein [Roseovarius sp. D22-M7]|uniref:hypothetical protein n=1 Tax=Roseovarius sp. D22-M7 TaxID=3127116 RepID=UPI0030104290
MHWRVGDLVQAIPIPRDDLNQAISRNGFRPEHTPSPGKERLYGWRDVVAIAASQELRNIGYGPSIAFQLLQEHLSPFLRTTVGHPRHCMGLLWLIDKVEDTPGQKHRCRFLQGADAAHLVIEASKNGGIVVNVGRIADRILDDLPATG